MNLKRIRIEDKKTEQVQHAQRWDRHGLISELSAVRIAQSQPSELRQLPILIRGILYVGILIAMVALAIAFTMLIESNTHGRSDELTTVILVFCAVAAGATALTGMHCGYYAAGLDEGAWGAAILIAGVAPLPIISANKETAFATAMLLMASIPVVYGYFFGTLVAWASASWIVLDLTDLRVLALSQAALFAILLITESKAVWRRRTRQVGLLVVLSGAGCILACNSKLPLIFGLDINDCWSEWNPLDAVLGIPLMLVMTAAILFAGFKQLDRRFVDTGLFAVVVALLTIGRMAGCTLEATMIIVGFSLLAIAFFLRRVLTGRKTGPTLDAPPVVTPRGWTLEDAQSAAKWLDKVSSGLRTGKKGDEQSSDRK